MANITAIAHRRITAESRASANFLLEIGPQELCTRPHWRLTPSPFGWVRTRPSLCLRVAAWRHADRGGWGRGGVHTVRLQLLQNEENEPNWAMGAFGAARVGENLMNGLVRASTPSSIPPMLYVSWCAGAYGTS